MNQGISHGNKDYQPYDPVPNWVSVGYYATSMSLVLELLPDGTIWDSGPTSTVGSNTTGFEIGGGLNAEISKKRVLEAERASTRRSARRSPPRT
jgi:hypothetical protein